MSHYNGIMTQAAIPFDTHRFVRNLVASGFTEKQAEALADEQINLLNSNLATKADIEGLRLATGSDIETQRLSTESSIETLRLSTESSMEALRLSTESSVETLRLSTESSVETLRLSTESSMEALRLSTEAKIERAKFETLKWLFSAIIAQSALIIGLTVTLDKLL